MQRFVGGFLASFLTAAVLGGSLPAWALDPADRGRLDAAVLQEILTTVSCAPHSAPRVCGDFRDRDVIPTLVRITFTDALTAAFEAFPGATLNSYGKVGRDLRIAITATSLTAADLTPPCFALLLNDLEKKTRALERLMNQKGNAARNEAQSHREAIEMILISIAGARATVCGS